MLHCADRISTSNRVHLSPPQPCMAMPPLRATPLPVPVDSLQSGSCTCPARRVRLSGRPTSAVTHAVAPSTQGGPVSINVTGRHIAVTEALQKYVLDKVSHAVQRYHTGIRRIDVKLSTRGTGETNRGAKEQSAEVTIWTRKHGVVRVEDVEGSMYASIDLVCDKLRVKLRKMKEKVTDRRHERSRVHGVNEGIEDEGVMDDEAAAQYDINMGAGEADTDRHEHLESVEDLVRVKQFPIEPLSVEAAITQVEQVGHDFYIFREERSGELQVIYKRKNGGYGLIAPQV